jgi:cell division protein FtsQ
VSQRATIRRGNARPGRAPAPAKSRKTAKRASSASKALASIPLPATTLRRAGNWALGGMLLAGFVAGIIAMKLPQMVGVEIGEAIGRAGFAVRNVEIVGRDKADRDIVYDVAMAQQSRAMPLVDLTGTRDKLLQLGWIKDARVSRRLPDTLVVDIVERTPAAVWQNRGQLSLIDPEGTVIAPIDLSSMPDLPLVIGPGANARATELAKLIEGAPSLKPLIAGATWIGNRRWDLRFHSGETLALPEGREAGAALAYFARQDSAHGLLGKGFVRFDLRDPSRMVVRVSNEPGRRVADPDPAKST